MDAAGFRNFSRSQMEHQLANRSTCRLKGSFVNASGFQQLIDALSVLWGHFKSPTQNDPEPHRRERIAHHSAIVYSGVRLAPFFYRPVLMQTCRSLLGQRRRICEAVSAKLLRGEPWLVKQEYQVTE
jgi:hypothetical protein